MNPLKNISRQKIELYLGLLSIFLIPINKHWVILSLFGWFVVSLTNLTIDLVQKQKIVIDKKLLIPILILPCFYILHIIGLIYTSNMEYGLFDLEVKMSMMLIPIIILVRRTIYKEKQKVMLQSLTLGILVSFFINITNASINYLANGKILNFFYCDLSPSLHPSYMSLYIGVSIIALIYYNIEFFQFRKKIGIIMNISTIVILLGYLLMLSSKAGIISFAVVVSLYFAIRIAKKTKPMYAIVAGIFILIIPFIVINQIPSVSMRFKDLSNTLKDRKNANIDSEYGSLARMAIIQSMYHLSIDNLPWGVGTGDTKDEITKYHISKGSKTITTQYLNAHNQFAQSTIALGIPGLVFLFGFIVMGLITAYRKRNLIFLSFILLISIHMLFESMLEQQAGVIFITLFYALFCIWERNRSSKQN